MAADWQPVQNRIVSRWTQDVSSQNPLPEYPRPQLVRNTWKNLNGLWNYAVCENTANKPDQFDGKILVPYPIESALSGVAKAVGPDQILWYQRSFNIPEEWAGKQILLNFGAVDWEAKVWINGTLAGSHRGGYDAFSINITDYLNDNKEQEIVVSVYDPTDKGTQPRGKQVAKPRTIWYTAVTGIWQTVWIEPVEPVHIERLKMTPNIDDETLAVQIINEQKNDDCRVVIDVFENDKKLSQAEGTIGESIKIPVKDPKLWTPDSPFLYDIKIKIKDGKGNVCDQITSYFGMRKISMHKDEKGVNRLFLNNKCLFQFGLLDQGWWPDGLYTAPTDEALRYDIEATKKMGFNLARKHVKIEPARWYYWCDKLGLLIWQDMPSGDKYIKPDEADIVRGKESAQQFRYELKEMIDGFYNHPCIVMWVPFNEGWGQFETENITQWIKEYDPSRLVNNTSGWSDRFVGDVCDLHRYPGPDMPPLEEKRAAILGEFGGLGLPMEGHLWQADKNWGYKGYANQEELLTAYKDLIIKLQDLVDKGLAAAIYTQTTDVEIEVNGMMTYDREIIKLDLEKLNKLNAQVYSEK